MNYMESKSMKEDLQNVKSYEEELKEEIKKLKSYIRNTGI
jgi:hypothetical protein